MEKISTDLEKLGAILGREGNWASAILGKLGVLPNADGTFDKEMAARALERLLFQSPQPGPSRRVGSSDRICRESLEADFERHGLKVVGHALRRGTRVTLQRPDGTEFYVLVYVALRTTSTGQVGFTVNHLHIEDYQWFAFIAEPFDKVYLRRREEIISRVRSKTTSEEVKKANVTFSAGTDSDLFENRVKELVAEK